MAVVGSISRVLDGTLQEPPQPACAKLTPIHSYRSGCHIRLQYSLACSLSTWQAAARRQAPRRNTNAQSFLLNLHTPMPLRPFPHPAHNLRLNPQTLTFLFRLLLRHYAVLRSLKTEPQPKARRALLLIQPVLAAGGTENQGGLQ